MSKKIIAILAVITILFVCVFAACEKKGQEDLYKDADEFLFVTDENGDKVLSDDGRLIVYVTDEDGKKKKQPNGEYVTMERIFEPFVEDGVIEDFGYKLKLPAGWKVSENRGDVFENRQLKMDCEIIVADYLYDDFYDINKKYCGILKENGIEFTWEENVELGEDFKGVCRMAAQTDIDYRVMYIFENFGNVYKLVFTAENEDDFIENTEIFCKSMTFKPYRYYPDVTAVSEESTTKK